MEAFDARFSALCSAFGEAARVHPPRHPSRLLLRPHLRRRHGLRGPARRPHRRRLHPHRGLSISILRAFGRASILENNIVQTTGNAGQSIASGVIFTLPALVFLGFDLEYSRIFMLALIGGWLGVLFMIPLRRQLIVKEHGALPYPEGTACADVLIAGEKGGSLASRVFLGLGLGGLYTFLQNENLFERLARLARVTSPTSAPSTSSKAPPSTPTPPRSTSASATSSAPAWPASSSPAASSPGSCVMPLIYFFGKELPHPVYPGQVPIAAMGPERSLGRLHQAHGRRSRRRRRPHHPAQDPAHHLERAHRRPQNHAPRRSRTRPAHPHGRRPLHESRSHRLRR